MDALGKTDKFAQVPWFEVVRRLIALCGKVSDKLVAWMVIVADGTKEADERLSRVLNSDPMMGIFRHVDAGYEKAMEVAEKNSIQIPL